MATAATSVFSSPGVGVGVVGGPISISTTPTTSTSSSYFSPVICRSDELLSCAKTAVKIAKKQQNQTPTQPPNNGGHHSWWMANLSDLHLYPLDGPQPSHDVLEDGLSLLRTMEGELKQLEGLVRRRGTTNDPTEEISMSVNRLEADTKELLELIQTLVPATLQRSGGQRHRHWELIQQWFQSVAQQQGARLKEILKVRGQVLAEQAQRRKLFQASPSPAKKNTSSGSSNSSKSATTGGRQIASGNAIATSARSAYDNPLFTMPALPPKPPQPPVSAPAVPSSARQNGGTSNISRSVGSSSRPTAPIGTGGGYSYYGSAGTSGGYYGGGGPGGMGVGGYGGSSSYGASGGLANTGMRQRRHVASTATTQDSLQQTEQEQQQLLVRQQERQTQQRLQEARQAEQSLAALGTLFGKMSSLISQQSEVIDKIEDDVELAEVDVVAGQAEIQTVSTIKKGNRGLILKVFGLLIFFIIFMRFYRN